MVPSSGTLRHAVRQRFTGVQPSSWSKCKPRKQAASIYAVSFQKKQVHLWQTLRRHTKENNNLHQTFLLLRNTKRSKQIKMLLGRNLHLYSFSAFTTDLSSINFNIIFQSVLISPKWSLHKSFSNRRITQHTGKT